MSKKFNRFSICIDDEDYIKLTNKASSTGRSLADLTREYINKGLAIEYVDESKDIIASVIREEVNYILKPHIERLAKIESKSGHMAATAAFLNVQALMDLVPPDKRKDVRGMYEKARKMAVNYMRTKTEDWNTEELKKDVD